METYILVGPTGVGKSEIAEKMAKGMQGEIVNMDMGQLYKGLSIGTAKPCMVDTQVAYHMYDMIENPVDYNVMRYRNEVQKIVKEIKNRIKIPLLVGGSLFYVEALLFELACTEGDRDKDNNEDKKNVYSWELLKSIDPERAAVVHPNDWYRIGRALDIWYTAKIKPSACKPLAKSLIGPFKIIWLYREKEDLYERINKRVELMVESGWQEEVKNLSEDWHVFLARKKLCGYDVVARSCKEGKEVTGQEKEEIKKVTRAYAKRQEVYWRRLKAKIEDSYPECEIIEHNLTLQDFDLYIRW